MWHRKVVLNSPFLIYIYIYNQDGNYVLITEKIILLRQELAMIYQHK